MGNVEECHLRWCDCELLLTRKLSLLNRTRHHNSSPDYFFFQPGATAQHIETGLPVHVKYDLL
jgi:hypothetical protein